MAADERLVFVDASAWVAITNRKDRNHRLAVVIFHRLLGSSTRLVATNWTIYEALTIVKSRLGITQAEWLWDRLSARSVVDVIRIDEPIERAAVYCIAIEHEMPFVVTWSNHWNGAMPMPNGARRGFDDF